MLDDKIEAKQFISSEEGSSTVEFAILFPAFITLITGCCWLALYAVVAGNVQQMTYEVARQTLQFRVDPRVSPDLCQHIGDVVVPAMAESFSAIDPARISAVRCAPASQPGWTELTLVYNGAGHGFSPLLRAMNNGSEEIVGRALIMGG